MACRTVRAKRELVRVVRSAAGTLSVDPRGKASGRGAYLCPGPACLARGLAEGAIAKALDTRISAADAERLEGELSEAAGIRTAAGYDPADRGGTRA